MRAARHTPYAIHASRPASLQACKPGWHASGHACMHASLPHRATTALSIHSLYALYRQATIPRYTLHPTRLTSALLSIDLDVTFKHPSIPHIARLPAPSLRTLHPPISPAIHCIACIRLLSNRPPASVSRPAQTRPHPPIQPSLRRIRACVRVSTVRRPQSPPLPSSAQPSPASS